MTIAILCLHKMPCRNVLSIHMLLLFCSSIICCCSTIIFTVVLWSYSKYIRREWYQIVWALCISFRKNKKLMYELNFAMLLSSLPLSIWCFLFIFFFTFLFLAHTILLISMHLHGRISNWFGVECWYTLILIFIITYGWLLPIVFKRWTQSTQAYTRMGKKTGMRS